MRRIALGVLFLLATKTTPVFAEPTCLKHQADRGIDKIEVTVANRCGQDLNVNICVNITEREPIPKIRRAALIQDGKSYTFSVVDFDSSKYRYEIGGCEPDGSGRLDSCPAQCPGASVGSTKVMSAAGKLNSPAEKFVTTKSGLQYEILRNGNGSRPQYDDQVEVHYRGQLEDGTEFDSSYNRGQTVTFPVGQVIPGWTEALQLMPVGSKFKLVIPPELGYGARGAPPTIGPNAVLVFEIELISIRRR